MKVKKALSFTIENYFAPQFIIIGLFGLAGAVALFLAGYWFFAFLGGTLSLILSFAQKGTSLDLSKKEIKKHLKVVGFIIHEEGHTYSQVEALRVRKIRMSQRMNSRGGSSTIRYDLYKGFLLADGKAHLITESKNKDYVVSLMDKLAVELNTEVRVN